MLLLKCLYERSVIELISANFCAPDFCLNKSELLDICKAGL